MSAATHDPCPACGSRLTRLHCGHVECAWEVCEACRTLWDAMDVSRRFTPEIRSPRPPRR